VTDENDPAVGQARFEVTSRHQVRVRVRIR